MEWTLLMNLKQFGERLRSLREARGLSQQQLADSARVSQVGLSKWERGLREPLWSAVVRLAGALDVDIGTFGGARKPTKRKPPKKK
jgi:transcriptional regulator with XRE-family HTH domain